MIPSVVAEQVHTALRDFLLTGFSPSNHQLAGIINDFLASRENVAKGPYLSLGLPFQRAPDGGEPFPDLPLGMSPYRHQRTAFNRLRPGADRSTIVATGTGSGKTECFLYPILEYCRTHAGEKGIKAIIIYPMNALATDQARRIAEAIHRYDGLRNKVTAGLFVGQSEEHPHATMGANHIITDRKLLREFPPDILLTNYKMLDYMLIRPRDKQLWRDNEPGTLRYLVVDELHTFDGAQGTDLACLVRRLRARLGIEANGLVCVGTSATIGSPATRQGLLEYVRCVFDQPFDSDAIVGETRKSIDEFLGSALIRGYLGRVDNVETVVDPGHYDSAESYIRAQIRLFLDEDIVSDWGSMDWRVALGDRLREHSVFVNILRALAGETKPMDELVQRMRASLPVATDEGALGVLNSLVALVSVARSVDADNGGQSPRYQPFLQVSMQFWVRELRRMVASIWDPAADGQSPPEPQDVAAPARLARAVPRLRHSDDLQADEPSLYLPLVQCRECHSTAWAGVRRPAEQRMSRDLATFYNQFFALSPDVRFFFPAPTPQNGRGHRAALCGKCGAINAGDPEKCESCGETRVVSVYHPDATVQVRRGDGVVTRLSRDCPYCDAREALIILGSRASSLVSVALGQLFASRFNGHKKVIAFSDNVQDAAHRAGFFAARTWSNILRAGIAQTILHHDGIPLSELPDRVVEWWTDPALNPAAMPQEQFVSTFIAPDRQWLQGYRALLDAGRLPQGADLPDLVGHRVRWDTLAELGFRCTIGRTLERTRCAAIAVDPSGLLEASSRALGRIREEIGGFRDLPEVAVRGLLLGLLRRMRERGAIITPLTNGYLASGGDHWVLHKTRALQEFGRRSAIPVYPGNFAGKAGIERIYGPARNSRSWYQRWCEKVLTPYEPLAATHSADAVLTLALDALCESDLIRLIPAGDGQVWALNAARFHVTTRVAIVQGAQFPRELVVAEEEAALWMGVPCLQLGGEDVYVASAPALPTWFGTLYREMSLQRIVAAEHTALIPREDRDRLQARFAEEDPRPWEPNLLSATPTLEMGIDIGTLSTVLLCSVPPAQANYLQRIGRAGRRDGNALSLTVATGQPHDLYFYASPDEMIAGDIAPPGVFLNASAVLERQLTAFCLDSWVAEGAAEDAVPRLVRHVLDAVQVKKTGAFPFTFYDYVQDHSGRLLSRFLEAFSGDLTDDSKGHLVQFLQGDDNDVPPLCHRLAVRLLEVVEERDSIKAQVESLKRRIDALKKQVQDEATAKEIEELTRERAGFQGLLHEINGRDTFNFLTDEGLIPNYAFPEAGVTLKSIIYRQREKAEAGSREFEQEVFRYERPAAAALSELAPESEFYAGGRQVQIDQVDLRVSSIEKWRLCPSCSYTQNLETGDPYKSCPRCGDLMWGDGGQRHSMLRLRQVLSATADNRSQIIDERDDREPLFFARDMGVDFAPEQVVAAYAASGTATAFGFEYINKAVFREMNFGRVATTGPLTRFAGREMPRAGFKLCRHCGKVQRSHQAAPEHARNCPVRDRPKPDSIIDCLYLYREFASEAIRMLLPFFEESATDRRLHSFLAALELGLRARFGGKVDHLRVMTFDQPPGSPGGYRRYLMLYDTVPGGTGYLKDLLADPERILSVFRLAAARLGECECNQDPSRDGCYRCIFAYRRSRELKSISRDTALQILTGLLELADKLAPVPGLAKVNVDPLLESELEQRFVEAFKNYRTEAGRTQIKKDLVNGKPGYILRVADRTYYIEPQVNLDSSAGVRVPCKPDFVIYPARSDSVLKGIAVFLDGFNPHRDLTVEDSVKRMSVIRAGYLQWSLTWNDMAVSSGVEDQCPDFLPSSAAQSGMRSMQQALDKRFGTAKLRSRLRGDSFRLLVDFLLHPSTEPWKQAVFTECLGYFNQSQMLTDSATAAMDSFIRNSPPQFHDSITTLADPKAVGGTGAWINPEGAPASVIAALPLADAQTGHADGLVIGCYLRDAISDRSTGEFKAQWNGCLRLFNLFQFLPKGWWISEKATANGSYPDYQETPAASSYLTLNEDPWGEVAALVVEDDIRALVEELRDRGIPYPEVGYEITGPRGAVIAECELAWPGDLVALVIDVERDAFASLVAEGWNVVQNDAQAIDNLTLALKGDIQ